MAIDKIAERLLSTDGTRTEADIQSDIKLLLLDDSLNLESDQVVRLEEPTGDGTRRRLDIAVGHCVIEVKKSLTNQGHVADALTQLAGYLATKIAQHERRYVGILTDGKSWILYDLIDGVMTEISSIQTTLTNTERLTGWLEAILSTERDVKPTPDEIRSRLGSDSPAYLLDVRELRALYDAHQTLPEIQLKRELWAKLLRTAFGSAFSDDASTFIDHTLLVVTAEIIAHAVVGIDVGETGSVDPGEIVSGRAFDAAHLYGVVEADFFDWVVQVSGGAEFVRALCHRIARFDWSKVEHDVLKHLYESVISQESRASLGEYYTPDWLAERVVNDAVSDPLAQRVLDPSCGSGTFLFHAISHYLSAAAEKGVPTSTALHDLTHHVLGVDIHPVAVTLARVTYLLAIGTERLLDPDRPALTIPVFLGDSLQWEQLRDLFHTDEVVTISTSGDELVEGGASLGNADLAFPRSVLADADRFDRLVTDMATSALDLSKTESKTLIGKIVKRFGLTEEESAVIGPTFATMRALHEAGRNHIWGFYVRNLIRPIWLSESANKVDVLVGNPPWLRYSKMTRGMQERYKALAKPRQLLAGPLGASGRDLSTLFVVRTVERYLKRSGQFSFVMPHGTLTRKAHAGFRLGVWSAAGSEQDRVAVAFAKSWDLVKAPTGFPMVSCVIRGGLLSSAKEGPIALPAEVEVWAGKFTNPNQSWEAVSDRFTVTEGSVVPQDALANLPESPYKKEFRQGAVIVPRALFMVEDAPRDLLGVGAGRTKVKSRRSPDEKAPWKYVETITRTIENDFIQETHLGQTIVPYRALEPWKSVLPISKTEILSADQIDGYSDLREWWTTAEELWAKNKRPADKSALLDRVDFHGQLGAQLPIVSHRVVYTASGNNLAAARLSKSDAVIEHKLYWASVSSADHARYLVGILNSETVLERVKPLQNLGLFGPRDFDKAVFQVPFAPYDQSDERHAALVAEVASTEEFVEGLKLPDTNKEARRAVREALTTNGNTARIEAIVDSILPSVVA